MTKRIIVTLDADGSIMSRTAGTPGPACLDEMGTLMSLTPHAVLQASRLTAEYEQPASVPEITTRNLEDRA
ncbi:hypothetical protein [Curtobacterium flaccumfaciens]|jgi:hypothetical protein|uniref:hypothetical protein n=1 Tax=Curtobacterium flaccumfaciens TaxID=2035 RepID=UPI0021761AE4|nr:hypothetical protein [Curtobacterium flaccumfaciens]MCS5493398.1 hypothetical protein [Curtobacterium flaccumfaciens pv. flaccumfaciens]